MAEHLPIAQIGLGHLITKLRLRKNQSCWQGFVTNTDAFKQCFSDSDFHLKLYNAVHKTMLRCYLLQ